MQIQELLRLLGNRCSAPTCVLRHLILTSAPSSIGMLTSAPCKRITCAEVNEIFRNLCRGSPVPKFVYQEIIVMTIDVQSL